MTRNEKRLLSPVIKRVIESNKESWWLLKRQIWDLGYQSDYEATGDFYRSIDFELFNLQPEVKHTLMREWRKANPRKDDITFRNFSSAYFLVIVEEIVKRATIAAMRTVNWD